MDLPSHSCRPDQVAPPSHKDGANLKALLLGPVPDSVELPHLADLAGAILALGEAQAHKRLLPLHSQPAELALSRRGDSLLASYYSTDSIPQLVVWERQLSMENVRAAVSDALRAHRDGHPLLSKLSERADQGRLVPVPEPFLTERRQGYPDEPPRDKPLAFGFHAQIPPAHGEGFSSADRADIHSLLFPGRLWAHARGRRIELCHGPVLLPAQKMLVGVRELVEASQAGRAVNLRLRWGTFGIGLRHTRGGTVTVTLAANHDTVTASCLSVRDAALPIVSLVSDLVRALVSVDRSQGRNLRVRGLREEMRRLRRCLKEQRNIQGFLNHDPDRLRPRTQRAPRSSTARPDPSTGLRPTRLRLTQRWQFDVTELDANATFLCGDRLVIASSQRALSLDRDEGNTLWVRSTAPSRYFMTGQTLVRMDAEGTVELCSIEYGEAFAETKLAPTLGRSAEAIHLGGASLPSATLVTEGSCRWVAIDLQTGQPRWRFKAPGASTEVLRSGRVLLATSINGIASALDVTSGEVVWRFRETGVRFYLRPVVLGETVIVLGAPGSDGASMAFGINLYSGELLWRANLSGVPIAPPISLDRKHGAPIVAIPLRDNDQTTLVTLRGDTGTPCWTAPDPGFANHGAPLCIDGSLVVNAPGGKVVCLDNDSGESLWTRHLGDGAGDEIPRRLEPVLRNGALFVPSASVHVLRPQDGRSIGAPVCPELVPDCFRVDERGWVYIAEESGLLSAYSSGPQLTLIQGGGGPVRAIHNRS